MTTHTPAPTVAEELRGKPTWTIADVCQFFGVSEDTLSRWRGR